METKWTVTRVTADNETEMGTFETESEANDFAMLLAATQPGPWFYTVSEQ